MPTSTTIRRTSFFMEPPSECVDPEELAEACGNRTHRSRVPPAPNGFEVRAGHQPRCASGPGRSIAEHAGCSRHSSSARAVSSSALWIIDGRIYFHDDPKGNKTRLIVL